MSVRELLGWKVRVEKVQFMPSLQAPADKPFPFLYEICISNESAETVTLRGRKWIVREENGETAVVEGEGVVGEMPVFETGDEFRYQSYHCVASSAVVTGAYFGETEKGERVFVRIPEFSLDLI
jgi:ApaG protein